MNEILRTKLDSLFIKDVTLENGRLLFTNTKKAGANKTDLEHINNYYNNSLPAQYLEFLEYTNGCILYNHDDLDGFMFFDINNIVDENEILLEIYEDKEKLKNMITIGTMLGDGDYVILKIIDGDNHQILDGYHEESPEEWKIISNSIDEFLSRLIDEKGKKYWFNFK